MVYQFIQVERRGPVTTVTLSRPEVMNALHAPMHAELQSAFDAFAADDRQQICVITGAGQRAFCAGSDLKGLAASGEVPAWPRSGYAGLIERFDLNKPLIAAVNGIAMGGGFEVALACDIIIASENARFGLPEPRVGAIAVGGGLHRLARQIGLKQAMGLILTGRSVTAAEGAALGFVNEVTSPHQLQLAVNRWCEQILQCAPLAVRASKETVMRGLDEPSIADAVRAQDSHPAFATWRTSEDLLEGARAFAEKRAPEWQSR